MRQPIKSMLVSDLTPWHIGQVISIADGESYITGPLMGVMSSTDYVETVEICTTETERIPTRTTISLQVGRWKVDDIEPTTKVSVM